MEQWKVLLVWHGVLIWLAVEYSGGQGSILILADGTIVRNSVPMVVHHLTESIRYIQTLPLS